MKYLVLTCVIGLIVTPALGGGDILPIAGASHLSYDMATGSVAPTDGHTRYGEAIWSCGSEYVNYFWAASQGEMGLDWGDIAGPAWIGGIGFSQFTNSQAVDGDLQAIIFLYEEENGWNSSDRVYIAGLLINNVPGSTHPSDEYWGNYWTVELREPYVLNGSDLVGDGLTDWGYSQSFSVNTPGAVHGPAVCGLVDPDDLPESAPGIEDAFDLFIYDPNTGESDYDGTYTFGGPPIFAQFYFELYEAGCGPNDPNLSPECQWFEVDHDCRVGMSELALLLSNYGCTTGCTRLDGDFDPILEGDGDVDLADLAALLQAYAECN